MFHIPIRMTMLHLCDKYIHRVCKGFRSTTNWPQVSRQETER